MKLIDDMVLIVHTFLSCLFGSEAVARFNGLANAFLSCLFGSEAAQDGPGGKG